jgi:phosphoglycolate phosphatase (TIGR01487 family)
MGKESLRLIKEKFDISRGIDAHYKLYKQLLKEKQDWRLEKIKLADVSAMITDFDRTITDQPGIVNEDLLKELALLEKPLILVTGRTGEYVKELCKKYQIWECVIAENGCFIYFPKKGLSWTFTSDKFQKAKNILNQNNITATYGDNIVGIKKTQENILYGLLGDLKDDIGVKENIDEIMLIPKGTDKGASLKLVAGYLGIDLEKAIIIGDGENDVDLFTVPGFKVAVANAVERLKLLADEVTQRTSVQGVFEVIQKLRM